MQIQSLTVLNQFLAQCMAVVYEEQSQYVALCNNLEECDKALDACNWETQEDVWRSLKDERMVAFDVKLNHEYSESYYDAKSFIVAYNQGDYITASRLVK